MDCKDYNQVASEGMAACMHQDRVMLLHLKDKRHGMSHSFLCFFFYLDQALLLAVDHLWTVPMVVVTWGMALDQAWQHVVDRPCSLDRQWARHLLIDKFNHLTSLLCCS
jgi:hypothetical protein